VSIASSSADHTWGKPTDAGPASVACKTAMTTSATSPPVLAFGAMKNRHFIFECVSTIMCISPCASVLAFSQTFLKALCYLSLLDPNTYAKDDDLVALDS
jgi:hypothetical protein